MYSEDFYIGRQFRLEPTIIEEEKMTAFAWEYDPLPIHTDKEFAKQSKFGRRIAPGAMSFMSVWAEFVRSGALKHVIAGVGTSLEWIAPVYGGDVLYGTVTVTDNIPKSGKALVELTTEISNQNGVSVMWNVTKTLIAASEPA